MLLCLDERLGGLIKLSFLALFGLADEVAVTILPRLPLQAPEPVVDRPLLSTPHGEQQRRAAVRPAHKDQQVARVDVADDFALWVVAPDPLVLLERETVVHTETCA